MATSGGLASGVVVADIVRKVGQIFSKYNGELKAVTKAIRVIGTDITVKQSYVRKMLNRLLMASEQVNNASDEFENANDERKAVLYVNSVQACVDVYNYEISLAGADLALFDQYQHELADADSDAFHFAYTFYTLFVTLLNQSQPCLHRISQAADEEVPDLGTMIDMLERVFEAYAEFLSELEELET